MSKSFLFEYQFEGAVYGFEIPADSRKEAEERLVAMGFASYEGEIFATIDGESAAMIIGQFDGITRIQ